jgi:hypothetical protein
MWSEIFRPWTFVDLGWLAGCVAAWAFYKGLNAKRIAAAVAVYAAVVIAAITLRHLT